MVTVLQPQNTTDGAKCVKESNLFKNLILYFHECEEKIGCIVKPLSKIVKFMAAESRVQA